MRKQILKGVTMLTAILVLAMATAVASANGQTLRADVPFPFTVGSQELPAGNYQVNSAISSGEAIRIRSSQAKDSAMRLVSQANGKAKHASLVFHRYGDRYFLAQVWTSKDNGRELLMSRQERAIQKELSRIAASKPASRAYETVEIALVLN